MALPSGLATQFGMVTEVTPGTPGTVTRFLGVQSTTLAMKKNTVQGEDLRAPSATGGSGLFPRSSRRVVDSWDAGGDVVLDVPFHGAGLLFQHMLGSFAATATQQAASTAYLQTHVAATLGGKTFTAQAGKPDASGTVRPFTYTGCKITKWLLTAELNKFLNLTVSVDAWQELTPDNPQGTSAGPVLASATYPTGEQFFHFVQGTIYNGGTLATAAGVTSLNTPVAAARVLKADVSCENALDVGRFFLAGTGGSTVAGVKGEQLENAFRKLGGNLTVEFFDLASYYDTFAADTSTALELIFAGPIIASTYHYQLSVLIPNIKYDGQSPPVPGPGVLQMAMPFTGTDNEVDNVVQLQYQSTDIAV